MEKGTPPPPALNPKPRNPTPETLNPKPSTLNPIQRASHIALNFADRYARPVAYERAQGSRACDFLGGLRV